MALSKKKIQEINSIAAGAMNEVLAEYPMKHHDPTWFDYPPDTWNEDEIHYFDSLAAMQDKIAKRIIELLNSKK